MQERDLKLVNEARARLEAKKKATAEAEAQQKGKELGQNDGNADETKGGRLSFGNSCAKVAHKLLC